VVPERLVEEDDDRPRPAMGREIGGEPGELVVVEAGEEDVAPARVGA